MEPNDWRELSKEIPKKEKLVLIIANFSQKYYGIGKLGKTPMGEVVVESLPSPFNSYFGQILRPEYCGNVFWKYIDDSDLPLRSEK